MTLTNSILLGTRTDVKDYLESVMLAGAIGTATPSTSPAQTALPEEVFRDPIDSFDKSVSDAVTSTFQILTTEANGKTIRGVAVFTTSTPAPSGSAMVINSVTSINKTSDIQLFLDTTIQIVVAET